MPGYICRSLFVEAGTYLVIAYLFKVNIEDYPPRTGYFKILKIKGTVENISQKFTWDWYNKGSWFVIFQIY